ncbi:glycosyltransferase family 2 protein [Candidatus Kuenenbacteria bacterium]|nr:glycosyltransferase family 2 protein [Candidatus Kuenenbacteria bacterium]
MVSVIIPVYNNWEGLEKCLASLAKQTFKDFEVVVVDDGSPEPSGSGISNFQFPISNFRIEHGGAPKARNFGFDQSKGELVLFCDADMELRNDCLEKMKKTLDKNPDKSYVYADFQYGWKKFKFWPFEAGKLRENNYVNTCSLLRREVFPRFDESLEKFQDWDLWLTLLDRGKTGVYIPEILFKASTDKGLISRWLPRIIYKLPFLKLKEVKRYNKWKEIVQKKHGIKK